MTTAISSYSDQFIYHQPARKRVISTVPLDLLLPQFVYNIFAITYTYIHKDLCTCVIMGSRQHSPICREGLKTKWRFQSIYQHLHSDFITRKHPAASKGTKRSLHMLPQYTVALKVSKNYSKAANLKQSIFGNCSSSFFLLQPAQCCNTRSDTVKTAIDFEKIFKGWSFCAQFEAQKHIPT